MNLLQLYDKLEKLVGKLPTALQGPILHEITPVKSLFLARRPPRLALLGEGGAARADLLNALFGAAVAGADDPEHTGWNDLKKPKGGTLRIFDARPPTPLNLIKNTLADELPDIFLLLGSAETNLDFAANVAATTPGGIIAVSAGTSASQLNDFRASALANTLIGERLRATLAIQADTMAEAIIEELPENARLEMARVSGVRSVQHRVAGVLIKSMVAICTAIGTQPIPLADFPILLSLQVTLVAGIMYVSGREMSLRLAGEFLGALGANVGVGIVLREGSRSLLKFLPGWGDAISGAIAGAGTYAVGKAAAAYFIDGISIKDARQLFKGGARNRANAPRVEDSRKPEAGARG